MKLNPRALATSLPMGWLPIKTQKGPSLLCKVVAEWKKVDSFVCMQWGVCLTVACPTTTHTQVCSL